MDRRPTKTNIYQAAAAAAAAVDHKFQWLTCIDWQQHWPRYLHFLLMVCGHIKFLFTTLQHPYGLNSSDFNLPNQITTTILNRQCNIWHTGHQTLSVTWRFLRHTHRIQGKDLKKQKYMHFLNLCYFAFHFIFLTSCLMYLYHGARFNFCLVTFHFCGRFSS